MRSILIVAAALAIVAGTVRSADAGYRYPWCLYTMADMSECTFMTLEQCNLSRAGVGGTCYQNPRYLPEPPGARAKARRVQR
ncbi:MAG TPA: DUF3551 domain-containing protein [Xanthobacteraceae bacterium]